MKKFSQVNNKKIDNKKYQEKEKNNIYSLIKENINFSLKSTNENLNNVDIDIEGTNKLVEKLNVYIKNKILEERIKVLQSVKSSIATGTLNIQKINEEIDACAETTPLSSYELEDTYIINDYDETINNETEFISTYLDGLEVQEEETQSQEEETQSQEEETQSQEEETQSQEEETQSQEEIDDLSEKYIKLVENKKNITWEEFFNENYVPENLRTNLLVDKIIDKAKKR